MTTAQNSQPAEPITAKHVSGAIGAMNLTYQDLSERTGIAWITISRFLSGKPTRPSTRKKIRTYLESEGFAFTASGLSHPELFQ